MPQQQQQHRSAGTVAVLLEHDQYREPLRAALTAAGVEAIEELRFSELNIDQLTQLQADVLIINLEPIIVKRQSVLVEIVDSFAGRIVFNDAEASAALADADRPRWIRHLASKLVDELSILPPRPERLPEPVPLIKSVAQDFEVWFLVASIGGPEALRAFLAELEPDLPIALVLVQHIGPEFVEQMIEQLDQVAPMPVSLARDGQALTPGQVFVVPPDSQTRITAQRRFKLAPQAPGCSFTPSIDQVLGDAVDRLGAGANAIVFSGMAQDGVAAASRLIEQNGQVWVQSPESCVVSSIVDGVIEHGGHKFQGNPAELAKQLKQVIEE